MRKVSAFNLAAIVLGLAFLYLPIAILVIYSFNASQLVTVWGGWSTRWYAELINDAPLVDAADPVHADLDRPQHRRQECALAAEDAGHVPAERFDQRDDDRAVQNDLNPADGGHGRVP